MVLIVILSVAFNSLQTNSTKRDFSEGVSLSDTKVKKYPKFWTTSFGVKESTKFEMICFDFDRTWIWEYKVFVISRFSEESYLESDKHENKKDKSDWNGG